MGHPITQGAPGPTLLTSALNILGVAARGDPPTSTSPGQLLRGTAPSQGAPSLSVSWPSPRGLASDVPSPNPTWDLHVVLGAPAAVRLRVRLFRSVNPGRTGGSTRHRWVCFSQQTRVAQLTSDSWTPKTWSRHCAQGTNQGLRGHTAQPSLGTPDMPAGSTPPLRGPVGAEPPLRGGCCLVLTGPAPPPPRPSCLPHFPLLKPQPPPCLHSRAGVRGAGGECRPRVSRGHRSQPRTLHSRCGVCPCVSPCAWGAGMGHGDHRTYVSALPPPLQ